VQIFVDSANLEEIRQALARGISGITTNPSILAKERGRQPDDVIHEILDALIYWDRTAHISVEVAARGEVEIYREALRLHNLFDGPMNPRPSLHLKVPIGWDELGVIRKLTNQGIKVNCTACMSYSQAIMAAGAGAQYVSLFWGRIRDYGADPSWEVRRVRQTLDENGSQTRIIVGSIRSEVDVTEALQSGAHVVTVPPRFLPALCQHPKTDEVVEQFLKDAGKWP